MISYGGSIIKSIPNVENRRLYSVVDAYRALNISASHVAESIRRLEFYPGLFPIYLLNLLGDIVVVDTSSGRLIPLAQKNTTNRNFIWAVTAKGLENILTDKNGKPKPIFPTEAEFNSFKTQINERSSYTTYNFDAKSKADVNIVVTQ